MRLNPIYHKETVVVNRTIRMSMLVMVFNMILSVVALLNLYSTTKTVESTGRVWFSSMLDIYIMISMFEFALLLFIVPALTAGSISGERERQTLDLLLCTKMKPVEIILGKLMSSFNTISILILSSFPILALVYVYGGLTLFDLLLLFCYLYINAIFIGSFSIMYSTVIKRTSFAMVISYVTEILLLAGTYLVVYCAKYISDIRQVVTVEEEYVGAGRLAYILVLNPAVNFWGFINWQAGDRMAVKQFVSSLSGYVMEISLIHWVMLGVGIQIILSVVFLFIAVHHLKKNG